MEKVTDKTEEGGAVAAESVKRIMTQAEYMEKIDTHQKIVQAKSTVLSQLTESLNSVRDSKTPLAQIKNSLQEEINKSNKAINTVSEEATLLKQKLRYHSERQIQDNIERLEYQLRNNNYKPREEQKILDEISMLQRSVRTLREYQAKQAENKKYRTERARLIDERNDNFSRIRELYRQEDAIKKEIAAVRDDISLNKRGLDELRQMRPQLEQEWLLQQQRIQAARLKRSQERRQQRQHLIHEKNQERRKLWEEYEASRESYEEEKNLCRVLISYLQSSGSGTPTPTTPASYSASLLFIPSITTSTPSTTHLSAPTIPATQPSSNPTSLLSVCHSPNRRSQPLQDPTIMQPPEASGSFYSKPKTDEEGFTRVNKRGKAKARREQKLANKVKDLPHTPDVLAKFSKLAVYPPKNTDEIPAAIILLQECLQRFFSLSITEGASCSTLHGNDNVNKDNNKVKDPTRPKSLPVKGNSVKSTKSIALTTNAITSTINSIASTSTETHFTSCSVTPSSVSCSATPTTENEPNTCVYNSVPAAVNGSVTSNNSTANKTNPVDVKLEINRVCTEILSPNISDSFFSVPMSYATNNNNNANNNNGVFSYAAITAKVAVPGSVELLE